MHPLLKLLDERTLTEIGAVCGISPQAVYDWRRRAQAGEFRIPVEHVEPLCKAYGMRPADLRPDLYEEHWRYRK